MSVHAHRTEGVTGSEGREGVNGVEGGIRVGGGNGDGNGGGGGNGDGDVDRDGVGAGTRTVVEATEGTQDGNGYGRGSVVEMRTGTWMVTGTGTKKGSGRAEERRKSARNRARVVDAMWETGETWVEREKIVDNEALLIVQQLPTQIV